MSNTNGLIEFDSENPSRATVHNGDDSYVVSGVHPPDKCSSEACVLHNPTDHFLRNQPLWWTDQGFERVCPHGNKVLDPDTLTFVGADNVEDYCCGKARKGGPRIKCLSCGDIIRSMHRHDFKYCVCGDTFIDGGTDYLRAGGSRWVRV